MAVAKKGPSPASPASPALVAWMAIIIAVIAFVLGCLNRGQMTNVIRRIDEVVAKVTSAHSERAPNKSMVITVDEGGLEVDGVVRFRRGASEQPQLPQQQPLPPLPPEESEQVGNNNVLILVPVPMPYQPSSHGWHSVR